MAKTQTGSRSRPWFAFTWENNGSHRLPIAVPAFSRHGLTYAAAEISMTLPARKMSALGHKQTFAVHQPTSALPPRADMCGAARNVRQGPIADIECVSERPCLRCQSSRVPGATRCPPVGCRTSSIRLPRFYYSFLVIVLIRYETTATARWALLFIVRAFFDDGALLIGRSQTWQSLWTIRSCEQFYTNSSLEFLGNRMVRNTKAKRPSVSIQLKKYLLIERPQTAPNKRRAKERPCVFNMRRSNPSRPCSRR